MVLIRAPGKGELGEEALAQALEMAAPFSPELRWLDERGREAAEIAFTPPPASHFQPRSMEERLRARLMGLPVDVAVLPLGGRRMEALVSDVGEDEAGAEVVRATMAAHGGRALLGASGAGGGGEATRGRKVLAAVRAAGALALFEGADMRVAYHAGGEVEEMADARIRHGDLTALLYLQGYRKDEFV